MNIRIRKLLRKYNPPRLICTALFGEKHRLSTRWAVGVVIMAVGVTILKMPTILHLHAWAVHITFDVLGGAVHALGVTPFLEAAMKVAAEIDEC